MYKEVHMHQVVISKLITKYICTTYVEIGEMIASSSKHFITKLIFGGIIR